MYRTVCEQLGVLRGIYGQLLTLARGKQPILQANRDPEALRLCMEREDALLAQATRAEELRMEAVGRIAHKLDVAPQPLTVSALAEHAEPDLKAAILEEARGLMEVLQNLRAQNEINRQLLEMNLSFTAFLLDTLREESLSSIYGATGGEAENTSESFGFLDSEI